MKNGEAVIIDHWGMVWRIAAGCETISLEKIKEIVTDVRGYQVVCEEDKVRFESLVGNAVYYEVDVPVNFQSRLEVSEKAKVKKLIDSLVFEKWEGCEPGDVSFRWVPVKYVKRIIKEIWPEFTTESEKPKEAGE